MMKRIVIPAFTAAMWAAVFALGQEPSSSASRSMAAVDDALFAAAASVGGTSEIALSELGRRKATDPELKKFSEKMIEDHGPLNKELLSMAGRKRIEIPREVGPCAQFCLQSLSGLSGEEFDRCYSKAQLVAHMDTIAAFKAEAERGKDPELKAFAAKALPKLEEHFGMIKPIAERYEKGQKGAH